MQAEKRFVIQVGSLLEQHLRVEEKRRTAVSRVATGSAFESWLAIETRLQMELNRAKLGLDGTCKDSHGHRVDRFWIGNEYNKVDLGVLEYDTELDNWVAAIEFKLLTNNKNWRDKVHGIRSDLYPKHGTKKARIRPRKGRFALVATMGKVFRDAGPYSWRTDLKDWERELWAYMLPKSGPWAGAVTRLWSSGRLPLNDCWLATNYDHFFQLHAFARTGV